MTQPDNTIDSEVEQILEEVAYMGTRGVKKFPDTTRIITNLIAQEANKAAVQELVIVKTNPYAINNLELRKWIDERIAQLTADKEQADG